MPIFQPPEIIFPAKKIHNIKKPVFKLLSLMAQVATTRSKAAPSASIQ
ncbi:hypothetical protein [Polycladidibacter stylochi]|nr:hypothetical protein [Pseudovibrio stylochi]